MVDKQLPQPQKQAMPVTLQSALIKFWWKDSIPDFLFDKNYLVKMLWGEILALSVAFLWELMLNQLEKVGA